MSILQIIVLAIIQGLAELLPVSSSAHVILAERAMGLDPSAPEMTFLLVMLHTGTMFAVLIYFWKRWTVLYNDRSRGKAFLQAVLVATGATGILGFGLKLFIEHVVLERFFGYQKGEIESLFSFLPLIGLSLFSAGVLIIFAGLHTMKKKDAGGRRQLSVNDATVIGIVQGLCLPFRGFSRSGATISASLLRSIDRRTAEDFSFALAVILTPPVILLELRRLLKVQTGSTMAIGALLTPGLIGMLFSFLAGLLALKWLSTWLENGRWHYFGIYCIALSVGVMLIYFAI